MLQKITSEKSKLFLCTFKLSYVEADRWLNFKYFPTANAVTYLIFVYVNDLVFKIFSSKDLIFIRIITNNLYKNV